MLRSFPRHPYPSTKAPPRTTFGIGSLAYRLQQNAIAYCLTEGANPGRKSVNPMSELLIKTSLHGREAEKKILYMLIFFSHF
jgi:hypothetical protein